MAKFVLTSLCSTQMVDKDDQASMRNIGIVDHPDYNSFKLIVSLPSGEIIAEKVIRLPEYEPASSIQL